MVDFVLCVEKAKDYSKLVRVKRPDKNGVDRTVYISPGLPEKSPLRIKKLCGIFDSYKEKKLTDNEKIEVRDFLLSNPIKRVNENFIKAKSKKEAKLKAIDWINKIGQISVKRHDIGEAVFNKAGVKTSFEHRIYQNKLDALPAISAVIKLGKVIDISNDFDGNQIKNTFIAAPIQIGNRKEILVVRLRMVKGQDNKFYTHDIFTVNNLFKNIGNAIKAGSAGKPVGEPSKSIAYIKNILQDILNVKQS
ncbi:MAG: hypothetical protein FWB73_00350 [Treponema sp.]|nr:hypothetical protein [Treponema sp.]